MYLSLQFRLEKITEKYLYIFPQIFHRESNKNGKYACVTKLADIYKLNRKTQLAKSK